MAKALVQQAANLVADGGTLAYGSNVTSGNGLFALISLASGTLVVSGITDSLGLTWTFVVRGQVEGSGSNRTAELWYAHAGSGGANTLTFDWSGAVNGQVNISEWSGFSGGITVDASDNQELVAQSATHECGATGVLSTADSLVLAMLSVNEAFTVSTRDSGFNALTLQSRADYQYKISTSAATEQGTVVFTTSTPRTAGVIASFSETGGGGGESRVTKNTRSFPLGIAAGIGFGLARIRLPRLSVAGTVLSSSLTHLMGIGGVTDASATYRARTPDVATLQIEYSTNSDLSSSVTSTGVVVGSAADFTGGETIASLSANTTYYYSAVVNGQRAHAAPYPSFKTFPAAGVDADVAIVFGSCMNSPVESSIFASMRGESPDVFIHLGDFHYGNTTVLSELRTAYRAMYAEDYQAEIVRTLPTAHTWDDHEYGGNNEDGDLPDKENALQAHKEYRPLYTLEQPTQGVWHSFVLANVEIFMLDTRYQRESGSGSRYPDSVGAVVTPDAGSSGATLILPGNGTREFNGAFNGWYYKNSSGVVERVLSSTWDGGTSKHTCTMTRSITNIDSLEFHFRNASMLDFEFIANNQVDWLVDGVNDSTKRWKLIVTSVVFNPTFDNSDSWGGFDIDNMESLYLRQHITADNVLLLSGDRHRSAIDDGTSTHWPECSASPLVQSMASMSGTWSNGMTTIDGHYYGLLELSATEAVFTIRNANGTTNAQVTPLTVNAA